MVVSKWSLTHTFSLNSLSLTVCSCCSSPDGFCCFFIFFIFLSRYPVMSVCVSIFFFFKKTRLFYLNHCRYIPENLYIPFLLLFLLLVSSVKTSIDDSKICHALYDHHIALVCFGIMVSR